MVLLVAMVSLAVIWFRSWFVVAEHMNRYLLAHPAMGDVGWQIRFWVGFLGYPLVSGAVAIAFGWLLTLVRAA